MPIVKISGRLVYFAHVPKCAGTAIEAYLETAFGPLAFRDSRFTSVPSRKRWTRSSPQHVALKDLNRLFPPDFFDTSFAVVRSPTARLVSAFRFQRDIEGVVPADTLFGDWLDRVYAGHRQKPWQFDNHTRPMAEFVPENARVFRLEEGLVPLVSWLRDLAGQGAVLPDEIAPRNVLDTRLAFEGKPNHPVTPGIEDRARVARLYAVDYERFGYDPLTGDPR